MKILNLGAHQIKLRWLEILNIDTDMGITLRSTQNVHPNSA